MNKFLIIIFLFVTSVIGEVNVSLTLKELLVGETGGVTISSDEGTVDLSSVPRIENLNWGTPSTSNQSSYINGKRTSSYEVTIPFVCSQEGVYKIPSFIYTVNGKSKKSPEFSVKVQKPQSIDKKLFSKTYINGMEKTPDSVFVGEQVQVVFKIYVEASIHNEGRIPTVEMADVQFRDYSKFNRRFSNVAQYGNAESELIQRNRFHTFTFLTEFTPLKVGKLKGEAFCNWLINSGRRQPRINSFFSRRPHGTNYPIDLKLPELKVVALPKLEKSDGLFLGLIGDWKCDFSINKKEVAAGEALNFSMKVSGRGNIDQLNPPKLDLDGFRFYDPEIRKNDDGSGEVSWVMIPLSEKSVFPQMTFSVFNTRAKKYQKFAYKSELKVTPGRVNMSTMLVQGENGEEIPQIKKALTAVDILFLKREKSGSVKMNLERNVLWLLIPVLFAPLLMLLVLRKLRHRDRIDENSDYRRQHGALKSRKDVIKSVKKVDDKELTSVILEEVVPWLNDVNGLPKGTSVSELSVKIDDSELAEILKTAELSKYMSSSTGNVDRASLLKKLSRFGCLLVVFFSMSLNAESEDFTRGVAEFEKGNYQSAKDIFLNEYEAEKSMGCVDASLLYNLGNCSASLDNYPEAIAWYEQARRLSPRDSDIMENLNFVRRKVGLEDLGESKSPTDAIKQLRDKLRPDEWLIAASAFWMIVLLSFAHCRIKRRGISPTVIVSGFVIIFCLIAYSTQKAGGYKEKSEAIVLSDTNVYKLPLADEDRIAFSVDAGKYARIVEEREIFCLVKVDEAEGWIEKDYIKFVWE